MFPGTFKTLKTQSAELYLTTKKLIMFISLENYKNIILI